MVGMLINISNIDTIFAVGVSDVPNNSEVDQFEYERGTIKVQYESIIV